MVRLWQLNNKLGRSTSQEAPYSLSFQWIDSLVFADQDEKKPLVLRGRLALNISRSVTTPIVSLKLEGTSRSGKSKSIRKFRIINESWQYIWPRNAEERKYSGQGHENEAGFSPCQYHDDWIPKVKSTTQQNFRALMNKPRINFGVQYSSPESYLHPGTYSIEFEIPVFAKLPVTIHHEELTVSYFVVARCDNKRSSLHGAIVSTPLTVLRAPSLAPFLDQTPAPLAYRWVDGTSIAVSIERNSAPLNGRIPISVCAKSPNVIHELEMSIKITEVVTKRRILENGIQHHPWLTNRLCRITEIPEYGITTIRKIDGPRRQDNLIGGIETSFSKRSTHHGIFHLENSFTQDSSCVEMDLNVPLPKCAMHSGLKAKNVMSFDISEGQLRIFHLLELNAEIFVFTDKGSLNKHRKFDCNVPFQLLPCEAKDSNIWLPRYPE